MHGFQEYRVRTSIEGKKQNQNTPMLSGEGQPAREWESQETWDPLRDPVVAVGI